jgi:hypothetical protein
MYAFLMSRSGQQHQQAPSATTQVVRLAVLLLPSVLLLICSMRGSGGRFNNLLWLGCVFQILFCFIVFLSQRGWTQPVGASVIMLYLIALLWLWLAAAAATPEDRDDWFTHLSQAVLLVVPIAVYALQTVMDSKALALRRAYSLVQRLADRHDWPGDLSICRSLPEVKALREAIHEDAAPALSLLQHPKPQVRVAALAALEFRTEWKPGQPEQVLAHARGSTDVAMRAAAISALGNINDRAMVESLAEFLRDPAWEVRRATADALLWDCERRWSWIRSMIHTALADSTLQGDSPLTLDGQRLTPEAIKDLTAWTAERGLVAGRAAATLATHYTRTLVEHGGDPTTANELKQQILDAHNPAVLRVELAKVLQTHGGGDTEFLGHLLAPTNPVPLRLLAADGLLAARIQTDEAVAALRDIARVPNREIALSTAQLLQRRLGIDLGLVLSEPLPPVMSRRAAEVTRAVMLWALASREEPAEGAPAPQ